MPLNTRAGSSAGGAGDSNTGGGYGVIKKSFVGADSEAERSWPYTALTDLEAAAKETPDEEADNSRAMRKKKAKSSMPSDRIGQLNYKTGSYVNGATRGLTGIMSGMDPKAILEQIIDEVRPTIIRKTGARGMLRPVGLGASSSAPGGGAISVAPGRKGGFGSKQGWFSPPQPKDSDPVNVDHAYTLRDIADSDEERPLRHADVERMRVRRRNNVTEKKNIAVLRSYVRIVSESP